jgi:gamma-glutamylputrescine oxidase
MWSGRSTVWSGNPRRAVNPLLEDLARTYPQLKDAKVDHVWTGVLGNTVHRMPQIGEVSPGLWLLSGFGGQGLNTTAMGGDIVARGIVEGAPTWRLFSPFELVWAGGTLGRAFAQLWYYGYRASERIAAARAQRREAKVGVPVISDEALAPPVVPEQPEAAVVEAPRKPKKKRRKARKKEPARAEAVGPQGNGES